MKHLPLLTVLIFVLGTTLSCTKWSDEMEIVIDCSGVYLQKGATDYKVCNEEILNDYSAGDKIKVEYDVLSECFGLINEPTCLLYHGYEDLIEITKIK